jgi:hypothetical protein
MTTITDKITTALQPLAAFEDPQGIHIIIIVILEFGELCTLVRNDLLGFQQNIPIKKISSKLYHIIINLIERFGIEVLQIQQALDALSYLILHIAKVKASNDEFDIIYE